MTIKADFVALFRAGHVKFSKLYSRVLASHDLSLPQYAILNILTGHDALSMTDISHELGITKPAVTNLVDRLEKGGFLKRIPHSKDRRVYLLQILPKGRELAKDVQSKTLGLCVRTVEKLTASELKTMIRFHTYLMQQLDDALSASVPGAKKALKRALAAAAVGLALACGQAWAMGSAPEPRERATEAAKPDGFEVTLGQAYASALARDENVAIRHEELESTFGDFLMATGEAVGDIDYVYTDLRQDAPGIDDSFSGGGGSSVGGTLTSRTRSEGKFVVKQPVFQGLKEFGAISGAGSLRKMRIQELKRSEDVLYAEVASSFFGLLRSKKDIETIEGIRTLYNERMDELKSREKIGRSRSSELATALSRLKALEATYADSLGTLAVSEALFEFYTGISPAHNSLIEEDVPAVPDLATLDPEASADKRPDIDAALQAMETAKSNIIVVQSELFPRVDLTANFYNKREGFQKDIDWDVLFTVDAPIFRGGSSVGKMQKAVSEYRVARLEYERDRRHAALEIRETYKDWKTAAMRWEAFGESVKASEENFKLQKQDYERSLVSNLDVLEALENLLDARREANAAYYDMKENYWRHQIAKGERA